MFYSHEILTNRKYGVATVWLMATLGAKSTTRKVKRKAIAEVDVTKACKTIMQPDVPMALRLQSSLLYGVSQVYSQQCDYVLADAQTTQNTIRTLFKTTNGNLFDIDGIKTRHDQLLIEDDPAFMPDMAVPELDFSFGIAPTMSQISRMSQAYSSLSPHSQTLPTQLIEGLPVMAISGLSSGTRSSMLANIDLFGLGNSSATRTSAMPIWKDINRSRSGDCDFLDDFGLDFEFDGEGKIVELNGSSAENGLFGTPESGLNHHEGDSAARGRVRNEHAPYFRHDSPKIDIFADRDIFMPDRNEAEYLPDLEAFPSFMDISDLQRHRQVGEFASSNADHSATTTAEGPKARNTKVPKAMITDFRAQMTSVQMRDLQVDYLSNMKSKLGLKNIRQGASRSKKLAFNIIWGQGIGNIGSIVTRTRINHPLAAYSGLALQSLIMGTNILPVIFDGNKKRPRDDEEGLISSHKSRRILSPFQTNYDSRNLGYADHSLPLEIDNSGDFEFGREAPVALDERHSSAMPWNITASMQSYRGVTEPASSVKSGIFSSFPVSLGGLHSQRSSFAQKRTESRLVSASPRPQREIFNKGYQFVDGFGIGYYDTDPSNAAAIGDTVDIADSRVVANEIDFDLFGPAARVDSQLAQTSQWVSEAHATETTNFFDFIRAAIKEKEVTPLIADQGDHRQQQQSISSSISFEELFPPASHSATVAAQAFHHVLILTTRNSLRVSQPTAFDFSDFTMALTKDITS